MRLISGTRVGPEETWPTSPIDRFTMSLINDALKKAARQRAEEQAECRGAHAGWRAPPRPQVREALCGCRPWF